VCSVCSYMCVMCVCGCVCFSCVCFRREFFKCVFLAIIPMSERAQVALRDSIEVIDYLMNQESVTWS